MTTSSKGFVNPSSNTVMVIISKTIIIRLCLVIYYLPINKTEKLSFVLFTSVIASIFSNERRKQTGA